METKLKPNEVYRGYTIVHTANPSGLVKVQNQLDEYICVSEGVNKGEEALFDSPDFAKAYIDAKIRSGEFHDTPLHRTRIGVSDSKGLQLIVNTPGGDITVESVGDTAYPDASIFINGRCVAFVEWEPYSKQFNLHYYGSSDDEPQATFENITE